MTTANIVALLGLVVSGVGVFIAFLQWRSSEVRIRADVAEAAPRLQLGVGTVNSRLIEVRLTNLTSSAAFDIVIEVPDLPTLQLVRIDPHQEEYFAPFQAPDSLRMAPRQDLRATMTYRDKFGFKYRYVLALAQRRRDDGAFNIVADGTGEVDSPRIGFFPVFGRTLEKLRQHYFRSRPSSSESATSAIPFSQTLMGGIAVTVIGGLVVAGLSSWWGRQEQRTQVTQQAAPIKEPVSPTNSLNPPTVPVQPNEDSSGLKDPCVDGERVLVDDSDSTEACLGAIVISVASVRHDDAEQGFPMVVTAVVGGAGLPDSNMRDAKVGTVVTIANVFRVRLVAASLFNATFLVVRIPTTSAK